MRVPHTAAATAAINATNRFYILASTQESPDKAEAAARAIAKESGFDEAESHCIAVAVREATANAVLHGNRLHPKKHVGILFEAAAKQFTVRVRDEGNWPDPASVPDPLAPENLLKPSGRGLFLMHSLMDEVRIRDLNPGTEITLIKYLREATRDGRKDSK